MPSLELLPNVPKVKRPEWVYALFCESDDGVGYIKIGRSIDPFGRLSTLAGSSPFKARYCAVYKAGRSARFEEEALHSAFKARRSGGEWFRFDLKSADDKAEFHSVSKRYVDWTTFPFSALKEMNRRSSLAFFYANQPKSLKRSKARQELRRHGYQRV